MLPFRFTLFSLAFSASFWIILFLAISLLLALSARVNAHANVGLITLQSVYTFLPTHGSTAVYGLINAVRIFFLTCPLCICIRSKIVGSHLDVINNVINNEKCNTASLEQKMNAYCRNISSHYPALPYIVLYKTSVLETYPFKKCSKRCNCPSLHTTASLTACKTHKKAQNVHTRELT